MSFSPHSRRRISHRCCFRLPASQPLSPSLFATGVFPVTRSARALMTSLARISCRGWWASSSALFSRPALYRRCCRAVHRPSLKDHISPPTPSLLSLSRALSASSLRVGSSAGAHGQNQSQSQVFTVCQQLPTSPVTSCLEFWFGYGLLGFGEYDVAEPCGRLQTRLTTELFSRLSP